MTIRSDIKDALASGSKSAVELAAITGHSTGSIYNACGYLHADGAIRKVPGGFALPPPKTPPPQISRLTSPAWIPPKTLRRPVYEAPGCRIIERLTGKELTQ